MKRVPQPQDAGPRWQISLVKSVARCIPYVAIISVGGKKPQLVRAVIILTCLDSLAALVSGWVPSPSCMSK